MFKLVQRVKGDGEEIKCCCRCCRLPNHCLKELVLNRNHSTNWYSNTVIIGIHILCIAFFLDVCFLLKFKKYENIFFGYKH